MDELWNKLEQASLADELDYIEEKETHIEKELKTFLEMATDLVGVINQNGELIEINGGWQDLLGWEKDEILNEKWCKYVHPEDYQEIEQMGEKSCISVRYACKDNTYKWLRWKNRYIQDKGITLLTAVDISLDKRQVEERIAYEAAFNREVLKNQFLSNISHEFKTPINIILSGIQLIQAQLQDVSEQVETKDECQLNLEKYTDIIKQNGYRLLRLIDNIMEVTRLDAGYVKVKFKNVDIIHLVEEVALSVVEYIKHKEIELVFDTEVEELIIACDPIKMERIILNLLSNAVKYMGKTGMIFIDIKIKDGYVLIKVRDTGIGIPEDKLENIFERFTQLESTLIRHSEGTGLGLSIVKSLVEMQNGTIEVESEEGVGSEFTISLPIRQVEHPAPAEIIDLGNNHVEKCMIEFADIVLNSMN